jgi:hypothetical protein
LYDHDIEGMRSVNNTERYFNDLVGRTKTKLGLIRGLTEEPEKEFISEDEA